MKKDNGIVDWDVDMDKNIQNIACLGKIICNEQHLIHIWGSNL